VIDYMDGDVAYLLGMLVARGELVLHEGVYRVVVHFPKGELMAQGVKIRFDADKEIRLGIDGVRERLMELLGTDVRTVEGGDNSWNLVAATTRNTMAWRNISALLQGSTDFPHFAVPDVLMLDETPVEYKREFIRGYADVAGNIRPSNVDEAGRHRVRLDTLNYASNWKVPVHLCLLLQEHLGVAVRNITWGHPNLGREWKEHQLNVYPEEFLSVGFSFQHKQAVLEELAGMNQKRFSTSVKGCPGVRRPGPKKPADAKESNSERLDEGLINRHFNGYWQICKALGCPRKPARGEQLEMVIEEA